MYIQPSASSARMISRESLPTECPGHPLWLHMGCVVASDRREPVMMNFQFLPRLLSYAIIPISPSVPPEGHDPVAPARGEWIGVRGRGVKLTPRARAVPGLHPGALGPPAGSRLTVRSRWPCRGKRVSRCPKGSRARPLWEANSRRKRGPAAAKAPDGAPRGATHLQKRCVR